MCHHEDPHLSKLKRLLREIADMAEHATLTGAYAGGAPEAARKVNAIYVMLNEEGKVPKGLFDRISPDADWSTVGVQARLLSTMIDGNGGRAHHHKHAADDEGDPGILVALAPFLNQQDLAQMVEAKLKSKQPFDEGILVALAPFIGSDLLGRLVREKFVHRPEPPAPPEPPTPPTPEPGTDIQPRHVYERSSGHATPLHATDPGPMPAEPKQEHERGW